MRGVQVRLRRFRDRLLSVLPGHVLWVYFFLGCAMEFPTASLGIIMTGMDISPQQRTLFWSSAFLPWSLKAVFGVVSDHVPLCGRRRVSYLIVGLCMIACFYVLMGFLQPDFVALLFLNVSMNVCFAWSEALIDAVNVEISKSAEKQAQFNDAEARAQSAAMFARSTGSLASVGLSIAFAAKLSPHAMLVANAAFLPLSLLGVLRMEEKKQTLRLNRLCNAKRMKHWLGVYWRAAAQVAGPVAFVFLLHCMPTGSDIYGGYLYDQYAHFPNWFFHMFKFCGLLGAAVGAWLFGTWFTQLSTGRAFVWTALLGVAFGHTPGILLSFYRDGHVLGIPTEVFIPVSSVVSSTFGRMALMPSLVLAAKNCVPGLEATMFNLFLAMAHVGALVAASISVALSVALGISSSDYSSLPTLMIVCAACALLPLLTMPLLLKEKSRHSESDDSLDMDTTTPSASPSHERADMLLLLHDGGDDVA